MIDGILADAVFETTTTTGTGTISLGGAQTGYEAFSDNFADGKLVTYVIEQIQEDANGNTTGISREVGIGTLSTGSPDTISRDYVLSSSNSDALVNFGSGTKDVYCVPASASVGWNLGSITTITADTTLDPTDNDVTLLADTSSAAFTQTLPDGDDVFIGYRVNIITIGDTANDLTISRADTDTINGLTSFAVNGNGSFLTLVYIGSNEWRIEQSTVQISDASGASEGPVKTLYRAITGAANNLLGAFKWDGQSDNGTRRTYAKLVGKTLSAANGAEYGALNYHRQEAGTLTDIGEVGAAGLLQGFISGLTIANNSTDSDHDVDIATGVATDNGNAVFMRLSSALTKQIDVDWASGNDAGGFPSGLTLSTDTTYHIFLVDDSNGDIDAGFDTSLSATNLLSDTGGSLYRRIGSVLTDGSSNIQAFFVYEISGGGMDVYWDSPALDFNDTNPGTSAVTRTLNVPTGINVEAHLSIVADNESGVEAAPFYVFPTFITDAAVDFDSGRLAHVGVSITSTEGAGGSASVLTNTSGQIKTRSEGSSANTANRGQTNYWTDSRR